MSNAQVTKNGKKSVINTVLDHLNKRGLTLFADDNGHAWHKAAFFDSTGKIITNKEPSIVGGGDTSLTDIRSKLVDTYLVEGDKFVCNRDVTKPLELRAERYQTSKENKALVAHLAYKNNFLSRKLILGTTLPISRFYQDGKINQVLLESTRKLFTECKTSRILNEKGEAEADMNVVAHLCLPESFLAYYDWAFEDDGNVREECMSLYGPICVIDIGGGTTDVATILGGSGISVDFQRSQSIVKGTIDCFNEINDLFVNAVNVANPAIQIGENGKADQRIINKLFETGCIQITGVSGTIDISNSVNTVKAQFVEEIVEKTLKIIGDVTRYQKVIFVGGGAVAFQELLEKALPNSVFLDEYANARGLLKVMAFLEIKKLIQQAETYAQAKV